MFVDIGTRTQIKLLHAAIAKAGSERRLEQITNIPDSSISGYKNGKHKLNYQRFKQLLSFLNLDEKTFAFDLIDPHDYRVKGGKAVYRKYLKEKRFEEIHKKMRKGSSQRMKQWHAKMKKETPEEYYSLQYSRFKKVASYKTKTKKGELVRNELEKEVADRLFELGIDYSYEPLVRCDSTIYFPDFKMGNTVIECTMWKGPQKAYALLKKIATLEKAGCMVKVIVPENLRCFYKPIEKNIIDIKELHKLCPSSSDRSKPRKPASSGAIGRAPDC